MQGACAVSLPEQLMRDFNADIERFNNDRHE
jgi:hypothetical protein